MLHGSHGVLRLSVRCTRGRKMDGRTDTRRVERSDEPNRRGMSPSLARRLLTHVFAYAFLDAQVICEKADKTDIPAIDKKKYLVPADLTVGQVSDSLVCLEARRGRKTRRESLTPRIWLDKSLDDRRKATGSKVERRDD